MHANVRAMPHIVVHTVANPRIEKFRGETFRYCNAGAANAHFPGHSLKYGSILGVTSLSSSLTMLTSVGTGFVSGEELQCVVGGCKKMDKSGHGRIKELRVGRGLSSGPAASRNNAIRLIWSVQDKFGPQRMENACRLGAGKTLEIPGMSVSINNNV